MMDWAAGKDDPVLALDNISVQFDKRCVLKNVNIRVYPGEFIGLIGSNGAGKSTLLKVILGLLSPTQGTVQVGGPADGKGERLMGYVPQKLFLAPDIPLRGRDLVALGLDGHRWGIPLFSKERKRRVSEILEAVDAARYADAPVGQLSGGEQQRLLIAQALLTDPQILLLDEPLSNLDIKSAYEVIQLVSRIGREKGIAVILVAHDMNPLLGVMDRVVYLADGKALMGQIPDVFRSDVLSDLYGYPVEVLNVQGRIMVVGGRNFENNGYPREAICCESNEVL
ncbi:Putative ABC transporter [Acididesulfobacillus acetoxydans]|uniref:ABC transporter n=1 Tax=Acididesulfobacillus acetoxydans TaxID=1561005 RepID=A0A8S0Y3E8_9FIRM|nr:ABC transporter ATP-binding protein [Acididesulfobacillus acetoxydans]CAA7601975.1 Putative ABC transporter [Acididesulfobacillus acetoxydans]CEJ08181.1 Manganese transport system ATP-binding protein MntB [Acididesulfobacillus acetoxydans]